MRIEFAPGRHLVEDGEGLNESPQQRVVAIQVSSRSVDGNPPKATAVWRFRSRIWARKGRLRWYAWGIRSTRLPSLGDLQQWL
jgi:hypothetical protein